MGVEKIKDRAKIDLSTIAGQPKRLYISFDEFQFQQTVVTGSSDKLLKLKQLRAEKSRVLTVGDQTMK